MDDLTRMIKFELRELAEEVPKAISLQEKIGKRIGEIMRRHSMGQSIPGDAEEFDRLDAELLALQERRR